MYTGDANVIRSIPAVTTRPREWRTAASPAASSQSRRICPPCTLPAVFASVTPIQRVRIDADSEGLRGSIRARTLRVARRIRGYTRATPTTGPGPASELPTETVGRAPLAGPDGPPPTLQEVPCCPPPPRRRRALYASGPSAHTTPAS